MPPLFELDRFEITSEGAFGILLHRGEFVAFTLERTYENPGEPVVKIPPGTHSCTLTEYHHGGYKTYEIKVFGHTRLLFHAGNFEDDSDGCILLGSKIGVLDGKAAVLESRAAFERFMAAAGGVASFELEVR